jgi:hypothetical protein
VLIASNAAINAIRREDFMFMRSKKVLICGSPADFNRGTVMDWTLKGSPRFAIIALG